MWSETGEQKAAGCVQPALEYAWGAGGGGGVTNESICVF